MQPHLQLPRQFVVEKALGGGKSGAIVLRVRFAGPEKKEAGILKVYVDAFDEWDDVRNQRPFREL